MGDDYAFGAQALAYPIPPSSVILQVCKNEGKRVPTTAGHSTGAYFFFFFLAFLAAAAAASSGLQRL